MCVNRMIVHLCMYIILTELIEDNNFLDNTISKSYFEMQNEKEGVTRVTKSKLRYLKKYLVSANQMPY